MFTLWALCHLALILCGIFVPREDPRVGLYAAAACSLAPTILVFALLFVTASLVGTFCRWVRTRARLAVSVVAVLLVFCICLGSLAASILFAYPIGFSNAARLAFVVFVVVTCGMLSTRKQASV